jgi:hypothetical protein
MSSDRPDTGFADHTMLADSAPERGEGGKNTSWLLPKVLTDEPISGELLGQKQEFRTIIHGRKHSATKPDGFATAHCANFSVAGSGPHRRAPADEARVGYPKGS